MNVILDNKTDDGYFSIEKPAEDGAVRRAFAPGQYDELEMFIPDYKIQHPEIAEQVNKLWTPEVIVTWKQEQVKNEMI